MLFSTSITGSDGGTYVMDKTWRSNVSREVSGGVTHTCAYSMHRHAFQIHVECLFCASLTPEDCCCLLHQVNHACFDQANLELVYEAVGGMQGPRRLVFVAKYGIEKGEFLSWDYNIPFDDCQCLSLEHRNDSAKQTASRVVTVSE